MRMLPDSSIISIGATRLLKMQPSLTERAVFLGQTGTGKTTLARYLLAKRRFVVIYDGKGYIDWKGYYVVKSLKVLLKSDPLDHPKLIFRPEPEEQTHEHIETFFEWIYRRRHCTCYIDEVYSVTAHGMPNWYRACVTMGRQRGIAVWSSVQRPVLVPLNILTESEHFYIFRLTMDEDRRRVKSLTQLDLENMWKLEKHTFYYVHLGENPEGIYKLKIGE